MGALEKGGAVRRVYDTDDGRPICPPPTARERHDGYHGPCAPDDLPAGDRPASGRGAALASLAAAIGRPCAICQLAALAV
jgi:hypothetical protein